MIKDTDQRVHGIKKYLWPGIPLLLFIAGISVPSWAGEPTDQVRQSTDKIIAILNNPTLQAPEKAADRIKAIREAVHERFDWEEMSRRTLARHWARRTEEERKEFIHLFGRLLERTYVNKIDGQAGVKIIYLEETIYKDKPNYGIVAAKIVTEKHTEIPVEYRVKKKANDWYVYDIAIEGISLIKNYRSQFNDIIVGSSYQNLIDRLKVKI